jgi:hypothetical protein
VNSLNFGQKRHKSLDIGCIIKIPNYSTVKGVFEISDTNTDHLASEFLIAGELLIRGYSVSITI